MTTEADGTYLTTALQRRVYSHCEQRGDCWIWGGYAQGTTPRINIDDRPVNVRRALWEDMHFLKMRSDRTAYESCGELLCVFPGHLVSLTRKQRGEVLSERGVLKKPRTARQIQAGRKALGKLGMDAAREIRSSDERGYVLAQRYGVTPQAISLVRTGHTWREASPFAGLGARP